MKPLFIFLLLSCFAFQTNATHIEGGNIGIKYDIGLTYEISVYLQTTAIYMPPDQDSIQIDCGDGNSIWLLRVNGPLGSSGIPSGEDQYNLSKLSIYKGEYTFDSEGDYIISYNNPNKVAGIINMNNSVNNSVYFETLLRAYPFSHCAISSNAIFTNYEGLVSFVNQQLNISFNAYNFDYDDSLVYEIIPALRGHNLPVPGYINPGDLGNVPGTVFSIDNKTGMLTWDSPSMIGGYNFGVKISQWKNGFFYGYTIRDVYVFIAGDSVIYGSYTGLDDLDTNAAGNIELNINAGDTLRINLAFVNDSLFEPDIIVEGEPLELSNTASYSSSIVQSAGTDSVVFSIEWIPSGSHVRTQPYYFNLRGLSKVYVLTVFYHYFKDVLIPVYVNGNSIPNNCTNPPQMTSIDRQSVLPIAVTLYPSPTTNHLNITTNFQSNYDIQYQIINTLGATVAVNKVEAKDFIIDVSALSTGIYFIRLQSGNAQTVKRFVKE